MTPGRICDLMMHWILEGRSAADMDKTRAMIELPPPGYTGSLRGTSWDPDAMLAGYKQ